MHTGRHPYSHGVELRHAVFGVIRLGGEGELHVETREELQETLRPPVTERDVIWSSTLENGPKNSKRMGGGGSQILF